MKKLLLGIAEFCIVLFSVGLALSKTYTWFVYNTFTDISVNITQAIGIVFVISVASLKYMDKDERNKLQGRTINEVIEDLVFALTRIYMLLLVAYLFHIMF